MSNLKVETVLAVSGSNLLNLRIQPDGKVVCKSWQKWRFRFLLCDGSEEAPGNCFDESVALLW